MSEPKNWYPLRSVTSAKEKMAKNSRKIYYEEEQKRIEEKIKRQQENDEKYGNSKYIYEGMVARIFGENLLDISSTELTKKDLQSFKYGYYEASDRQISLMCSDNKISDFVEKATIKLTHATKEEIANISVKDLLFAIGNRDAKDENVDISKMEECVRKNENYSEGYIAGKEEMNFQKGKGKR